MKLAPVSARQPQPIAFSGRKLDLLLDSRKPSDTERNRRVSAGINGGGAMFAMCAFPGFMDRPLLGLAGNLLTALFGVRLYNNIYDEAKPEPLDTPDTSGNSQE